MKPNLKAAHKVGPEIIEHWYSLVSSQQFSSQEFYDHIEEEISEQKVPALEISRVDLSEGGLLSDNRAYLRMRRERIFFDICAAPVGVNYFFSYRFYIIPAVVRLWEIAIVAFTICLVWWLCARYIGPILGPTLLIVALGASVWLMRNAIGLGLRDVDSELIKLPVLGSIYERFFRKDTYYRQDLRIAYGSIVAGIVKQRVAELTAEKGVELVREYSYSPVFDGLYEFKRVTPRTEAVGP